MSLNTDIDPIYQYSSVTIFNKEQIIRNLEFAIHALRAAQSASIDSSLWWCGLHLINNSDNSNI